MTTRTNAPAENFARTPDKLAAIRAALFAEYRKRHKSPWIVAYSGGKYSTLLLQLVFETLLALPAEERKRRVHVVGYDTGTESPPATDHLRNSIGVIQKAIGKMDLPMTTTITKPCIDQTFWVNVIGRGCIPSTRSFRWRTDHMKNFPANQFIRCITNAQRKSVLLVGARNSAPTKCARPLVAHNQIKNCRIFSPLDELTDGEAQAILAQSRPAWGGSHRNLVNSGFGKLAPLLGFRKWVFALRKEDTNRLPFRRDGSVKYRADGSRVRGPFKMEVRRDILKRLKTLESNVGATLLSKPEETVIEDIWWRDELQYESRDALIRAVGAVPAV